MKPKLITCKNPECLTEFHAERKWQLFCSPKCRNTFHNKERVERLETMAQRIEELEARNREVEKAAKSKKDKK